MTVVNGINWLIAVLVLIGLIRWSWQRSPLVGSFMLVGVLARAIAGVALFWISLRHLPIFPSLQLGNGFWVLALDGVSYYNSARIAAEHGLSTISSASASPAYVRMLAIALRAFGESPLTAVLLNTMAYALSCAICILMWPRHPIGTARHARTVAVAALSLAPSLLLASTQPLKDQVFALAVVGAIACIKIGSTALAAAELGALASGSIAFAGAAVAVYAISGIRAYYGLMIVLATAMVLWVATVALPLRRWAPYIAATIAATTVLWIAFAYGAGPYAVPYEQFLSATLHIPSTGSPLGATADPLDSAREGFATTGGATNIVRLHPPGSQAIGERVLDEATGLMALSVPISLLRGLSIVNFRGGRGLLAITDIDTIFLDLTIATQLWILLRHRQWRRPDVVFLMFAMTLATVVMVPMAYVVTNYGTMFRLRIMYAVPLWLSGAALGCNPPQPTADSLDRAG